MTALEDRLWLASQSILAPGSDAAISDRVRRWLMDHPQRGAALDVGCGPRSRLAGLGVDYLGVDLYPGWGIPASAMQLPFASGVFESVWSFGLLHHLEDTAAREAIFEMLRVARPGAFVVVFDGVLPEDQRFLARHIRRLDRGSRFRAETEFNALLAPFGTWEGGRFTYSQTGLEGVFCWIRTPEPVPCR